MSQIKHNTVKVQRAREDGKVYREILVLQEGDHWLEYFSSTRGLYHEGPCVIQLTTYCDGGVDLEVIPGSAINVPSDDGYHHLCLLENEIFINEYSNGLPDCWRGPISLIELTVQGGKVETVYISK